jgi:DNA-directed RNA polymerase specialized sigma24 family protein
MQDICNHIFPDSAFLVSKERKLAIKEAIHHLPPDNRTVIQLHFFENISRKDISIRLSWSLSKVNAKLTRGLSRLRWELNPAAFDQARRIFLEQFPRT